MTTYQWMQNQLFVSAEFDIVVRVKSVNDVADPALVSYTYLEHPSLPAKEGIDSFNTSFAHVH